MKQWPRKFTKEWAADYIYSAYRWQLVEKNEDAWKILHALFMEVQK